MIDFGLEGRCCACKSTEYLEALASTCDVESPCVTTFISLKYTLEQEQRLFITAAPRPTSQVDNMAQSEYLPPLLTLLEVVNGRAGKQSNLQFANDIAFAAAGEEKMMGNEYGTEPAADGAGHRQ